MDEAMIGDICFQLIDRSRLPTHRRVAPPKHDSIFPLKQTVRDIHAEINRLAKGKGKKPKFRTVFKSIDRDGGGSVDVNEFFTALGSMG